MGLTWPLEQQGSKGEDVRTVQYLVTAQGHPTGVDGIFGPSTKTAVEAFQSSRGLAVDGIVGTQTWPQLIIQVRQGSNGDAVRAVQSQIHSRGDGANQVAVDGVFGSLTNDAVRAFQTLLGLSVDGIVGPQTWSQLIIEVQQGDNGDAVSAVQSQIHSRGDGANQITVDGNFGSVTDGAVRAFQTLLGLSVDGIVGPHTWIHLVNGYLAAPDPQTPISPTPLTPKASALSS